MNLLEIEKIVGQIQSNLFKNSNSFAVGMLKSHFKGAGLQFKEHQVYNPGDDVRFIDWKLSAKTQHTFVKTFEEERNVEIVVVIDITDSMFIGYKNVSKMQLCVEIACLLYLLAKQTKDFVKIVLFTDRIITLPTMQGHAGIALLVSSLQKENLISDKGNINVEWELNSPVEEKKKMAFLKSYIAKGKEVVFLSDFNDLTDLETMNKLIYRRNMHCFKVTSPLDNNLKSAFSFLGRIKNRKSFVRPKTQQRSFELNGRWKELAVEGRYLEEFVREML